MLNSVILFLRKYFIWIAVVLAILIPAIFFLNAPRDFPSGMNFSVKNGDVLTEISQKLKDSHVIRSKISFEFFTILFGGEKHIVSGDYYLNKPIPVFKVARRFSLGQYYQTGIRITIPEGRNTLEVGELLAEKIPNFNSLEFNIVAKNYEGYLFPDTYFFFPSVSAGGVVQAMKNNFDQKIAEIKGKLDFSKYAEKEIIIMASIIEKEAGSDEERAIISGILWKRIEKGIRLQVDAEPGTYDHAGLPLFPISNPGLKSIIAAANPEASDYFYYLHDKNGKIHYAKTFEEHKLNKKKYL